MAIVKTADKKISSYEALSNAIDYITNEVKASCVTGINCCGNNTEIAAQFYITRQSHNQDKGILAHHFIQSFSPDDNITLEEAHRVGKELAEKCFPNYQVLFSTHKDKDHIHNHFILNSVNLATGYKYHDNKSTLETIRAESDRICKRYNFNVIEKARQGSSLDQTTYQLAKKGKSWKVTLVNDLDAATSICHSKVEFIDYLNKRGYFVKYTDLHITITKNGEKKGVRVDTLAKQFGQKYTKVSLEKTMGFYKSPPLPALESHAQEKQIKPAATEWERYEKWFFKNNQTECFPISNQVAKSAFKKNPISFTKRLYLYFAIRNAKKKYRRRDKKYTEIKRNPVVRRQFKRIGNIAYSHLVKAAGENYYVKITSAELARLVGKPIFYSAKVNMQTGETTVTIKAHDKKRLMQYLEITDWRARDRHSCVIRNNVMYKTIKDEAAASGLKPQYLVVTPEQLDSLQRASVPLAYFAKETKFNICFSASEKERIEGILRPVQQKISPEQKAYKINNELKVTASRTGDKLLYKVLPKEIANVIQENVHAAVFPIRDKPDLNNVVYLASDSDKVQTIIKNQTEKKKGVII